MVRAFRVVDVVSSCGAVRATVMGGEGVAGVVAQTFGEKPANAGSSVAVKVAGAVGKAAADAYACELRDVVVAVAGALEVAEGLRRRALSAS